MISQVDHGISARSTMVKILNNCNMKLQLFNEVSECVNQKIHYFGVPAFAVLII